MHELLEFAFFTKALGILYPFRNSKKKEFSKADFSPKLFAETFLFFELMKKSEYSTNRRSKSLSDKFSLIFTFLVILKILTFLFIKFGVEVMNFTYIKSINYSIFEENINKKINFYSFNSGGF